MGAKELKGLEGLGLTTQQAVKFKLPADVLEKMKEVKILANKITGGDKKYLDEQLAKNDMAYFSGDREALERLGLEPFNFKVDSTRWKEKVDPNGIEYLENPEGDIWEIKSEYGRKEQLFTPNSAIRETTKAGKKIPEYEKWEKIVKPYLNNGKKLSKDLGFFVKNLIILEYSII